MCHFNSDSSRFFLQPLVPQYTMHKVFNEMSRQQILDTQISIDTVRSKIKKNRDSGGNFFTTDRSGQVKSTFHRSQNH
jgi:hypothetical protein